MEFVGGNVILRNENLILQCQKQCIGRGMFSRTTRTKEKEPLCFMDEEVMYILSNTSITLAYNDTLLNSKQWCKIASDRNQLFTRRYFVYTHFKQDSWVIKSGLNYGVDFLLYDGNPEKVHSSFAIVISAEKSPENYYLMITRIRNCTSLAKLIRAEKQKVLKSLKQIDGYQIKDNEILGIVITQFYVKTVEFFRRGIIFMSWNLGAKSFNPNAAVFVPPTQAAPVVEEITATVADLKVEEDEFFNEDQPPADEKEKLNIVFIGHVDAGKSTLGGQILLLTGMVDKRTIEKYEKEAKEINRESWYLSWALDTNSEERNKGITVQVGKAFFETEKRKINILDAPGHKSFVQNMIGGATQADAGVLVISARKGEFEAGFERGQTREHAMLAKTYGLNYLVCVVNKMDDPTVEWSKERYDDIVSQSSRYLKSLGYASKDTLFLPVSGFLGLNIKERLSKDICPWYSGPCLLEVLEKVPIVPRQIKGPLMLPVSDRIKDSGLLMVSGKIESGSMKKGDKVIVMPNKTNTEVAEILVDEVPVTYAHAGDSVSVRLKTNDDTDILPGFVVCDEAHPCKVSNHFLAQLKILKIKNIITSGYSSILHMQNCTEEVTIAELIHLIDKRTKKRFAKKPTFVKEDQIVVARLEAVENFCMEAFGDHPQLGRFSLRDEGETVAYGKIIKVLSSK